MFSPQRKAVALSAGGRGKTAATAFLSGLPPPPPPMGSLGETASLKGEAVGDENDWKRFKEAGFLDQSAMARKDHDALVDKVSRLESQLFGYQYNMGLLLIEKEDWTSKYEELRQALAETHEILKREQTAHLIALSEAEKREENLRKVLVAEKQCVGELEKALREMNVERVKVKDSSDSVLAEANTLLIGAEEKSLEMEKKLQAAEAKLAELNRRSASLDIRLEEVEARESVLQREQQTLRAEREAHKARFGRQKEDLQEWEQKLHEMEDSLCKGQRTLVEREEKANENERIFAQKEMRLQEVQKKIDSSNLELNQKKEDINKQLEDLLSKEKEADSLRISLEKKGLELQLLEEKLSAREKIEVDQLLDEHKVMLDIKMQEFDLELEEKRTSHEKELFCKGDALQKKETEVNHREEMLRKREQALHEKLERLKADDKTKIINEREKVVKAEERKLGAEKKQLVADKESLQCILAEVEKIKAENIQLEEKISEERENLRLTNKERSEHERLQLELKQEIEKYRIQNELLLSETAELKQEKEKFEEQWEDLDEKRSQVSAQHKELADEKEYLEKLQLLEEERLKEEKRSVKEFIQRELENLKLEKDSFADKMKDEQLALVEKAQLEHSQTVQDFESQRRNLENEMQNQREKMEKLLHERQRAFEDERERELKNIEFLKEVSHKEMEEVKMERLRVEKKRKELSLNKEKLKADQLEMQNDIEQLGLLSKKIKDQREELIRERSEFLAFVDKLNSCNDSREIERELMLSGFHVPGVTEQEVVPQPSVDEEFLERSSGLGSPKSGGRMSWLQKCTSKILKLSPGKKSEHDTTRISSELPTLMVVQSKTEEEAKKPDVLAGDGMRGPSTSEDRSLSLLRKCSATDAQTVEFEKAGKVDEAHSNLESKAEEGPEDSLQSEPQSGRRKPSRRRTSGLHRTRTIQAAVKEAEAFLGDEAVLPNKSYDISESLGDSVRVEKGEAARKRQRPQTSQVSESEQDGGDSEACSGSVTTGGRRKRRQQTILSGPGEERYNLRSRRPSSTSTAKVAADPKKTKEAGENDTVDPAANPAAISVSSSGIARKSSETKELVHMTTAKTVEFSESKVVRFITPDQDISKDTTAGKSVENTELSLEVNDTAEGGGEDESGSTVHESEDDHDDDEDNVQPGEVSVGRKIWNFFTT